MNIPQLEDIVYELHCEQNELIIYLKKLNEYIADKTATEEQLEELKAERTQVILDIRDIECDISMFNEAINKFYYSELDTLEYTYQPNYEVFASGEF